MLLPAGNQAPASHGVSLPSPLPLSHFVGEGMAAARLRLSFFLVRPERAR
jgi:hypothetical protein